MKFKSNEILALLLIVPSLLFFSISIGYTKDNYNEEKEYENLAEVMEQKQFFYDDCEKSVVQICAVLEDDKMLGSGFFIDNNIIVTNYHVVKNSKIIYILFKDDEMAYRASIETIDENEDLVILRLVDKINDSIKVLELSDDFSKNEIVYACGYDLIYNIKASKVIEKDYEYKGNNYIKIDKPVNQGKSGGPVLNQDGKVIGVVMFGNVRDTSLIPAWKIKRLFNV